MDIFFIKGSKKGGMWEGHSAGVSEGAITWLYQFVNKDKILHLIEIGASGDFSLEAWEAWQ